VIFSKQRKAKKAAHELLRHTHHVRNMREDILDSEQLASLASAESALRDSFATKDHEQIESATNALSEALNRVAPAGKGGGLRENFEILVVAIAVAMGLRAYFIQPFKIPTGSMQPTLYGIHSVEQEAPKTLDRFPLKLLKFATTGELYVERRAKTDGVMRRGMPERLPAWDRVLPLKLVKLLVTGDWFDPFDPSVEYFMIADQWHKIPKDALDSRLGRMELKFSPGAAVKKGDLLWSGSITRGDHVFVNKLIWNFRKPTRGEIMVFSTRDIQGLPPGTHYIKRMCGLPTERVSIRPPQLVINGQEVHEPESIARIARKDPGYDGFALEGQLISPTLEWPLTEGQYFAMGDNTLNSRDSRYWGPVPELNLVGPAAIVYWPLSKRWGRANKQ